MMILNICDIKLPLVSNDNNFGTNNNITYLLYYLWLYLLCHTALKANMARARARVRRTRGRRFPWKIDGVFAGDRDGGGIFISRTRQNTRGEQHRCARTVRNTINTNVYTQNQGSKVRETAAAAATVSISSVGYVILSCAHVNYFTFERVPACRRGRPLRSRSPIILILLL